MNRAEHWSEAAARWGLCVLAVWAPLAFSSVEMWSRGVLIMGTWALFALWALGKIWAVPDGEIQECEQEWRELKALGWRARFWSRHPWLARACASLSGGRVPDPGALPRDLLQELKLRNFYYAAGRRLRRTGLEAPMLAFAALLVFQMLPLPPALMRVLSPGTHELYGALFPGYGTGRIHGEYLITEANRFRLRIPVSTDELLAEESNAASAEAWSRGDWLPLSLYPGATTREGLYALTLLLAVFLVSQVFHERRQMRFALYGIIGAAFAAAVTGLAQRLGGVDRIYGLREVNVLFASPMGPFVNRNHFCALMELAFPVAAGLALLPFFPSVETRLRFKAGEGAAPLPAVENVRRRPRAMSFNLAGRAMSFLFLAALMLLAVSLSGSRGGLLASVLALALFPIAAYYLRRGLVPSLLTVFLLLGLAGGAVWHFGKWDTVREQAGRIDVTDWSGQSRITIWGDALRGIREFPAFGTGWGTFLHAYPYRRTMPNERSIAEHAESDFFELWFEAGTVGLLLVAWMAAVVFMRGRPRTSFLHAGLFIALVSVAFHAVIDFPLHIPGVSFPFALSAALFLAMSRTEGLP